MKRLLLWGVCSWALFAAVAKADLRGDRFEYDPGPELSTHVGKKYAQIFASTPDYRAIGRHYLGGGEKFRWKFGPMFYRGRLTENGAKVLVIGQEGAEDENISDRSFTGGTGTRMQNFLAALGLDRSYLFVNTFLYTIQGQYADYAPMIVQGRYMHHWLLNPGMFRMAQTTESPIVQHRHKLFEHVLESNRDSLSLVVAVGTAAQDSLGTFILSRGGDCQADSRKASDVHVIRYGSESAGGNKKEYFPLDREGRRLDERDPQILSKVVRVSGGRLGNGLDDLRQTTIDLATCRVNGKNNTLRGLRGIDRDIRFVWVMHPGSNSPQLESNFQEALSTIQKFTRSGWRLPADDGMRQPFASGFKYGYREIPHRDFRFGLPDVLGSGGTFGTRRDGGASIEFGESDPKGSYPSLRDAYVPSSEYVSTDLPNEPNKKEFWKFDGGPGVEWARIFMGRGKSGGSSPYDLQGMNRTAAARFGAGAIYRGRPDSTEVIVLADQTSHDDMWVGRALMGLDGQRLQAFLAGLGIGLNYTVIRTLPMDTLGASGEPIGRLLAATSRWRTNILLHLLDNDRNVKRVRLVLTLGAQADRAIEEVETGGVPVVSLTGGYEEGFKKIRTLRGFEGARLDTRPVSIPREDIPYGMRRWVGTSGDRVVRATGSKSGELYKIVAPAWAVR